MITFVDTNILLDVFLPDPDFGKRSSEHLEKAFHEGSLIINVIIYAELAPQFGSRNLLDSTLAKLGIQMLFIEQEIAYTAGRKWKQYRKAGGKRDRILADFLIGAHAQSKADILLSRDRGFYKKYFKGLKVMY
jgi:predicted nucleic acid-binding protein